MTGEDTSLSRMHLIGVFLIYMLCVWCVDMPQALG
jgi:hypothetical protein